MLQRVNTRGSRHTIKAIIHCFTLCSNWHCSIHQAHKRGMESALQRDTSLVLICSGWPHCLRFSADSYHLFFFTLLTNRWRSASEWNKTETLKCSLLLILTESKESSERSDLNANDQTSSSCSVFESDCSEQWAPGTVHHPLWQTHWQAISLLSDKSH